MKLIAAVDENWGIGYQNKLLVSIPEDMKMFRNTTSGHVVVMGRKTLESFPGGKPLPNRTNVVLTTNPNYKIPGEGVVVNSMEQLFSLLKEYREEGREIFVIGGESIYRAMLPYCDTAYITKIAFAYQADAYFPNLDQEKSWHMTAESEEQTYFDMEYFFTTYENDEVAEWI